MSLSTPALQETIYPAHAEIPDRCCGCMGKVVGAAIDFGGKVCEVILLKAKDSGKNHAIMAGTRAVVQVASIAIYPMIALGGIALSSAFPEKMKIVTEKLDIGITGLWKNLSPTQRLLATGVGCVTAYLFPPILSIPGGIFSAKVGSELVQKNLLKEKV